MTTKGILSGTIVGAIFGYFIANLVFKEVLDEILEKNEKLNSHLAFYNFELYYFFVAIFSLLGTCFNTVRCLFSLCLPSLAGRTGRTLLYSLLFTTILENPVFNTVYHVSEMSRSLTCSVEQQANNADLIAQSLNEPVIKSLKTIVEQAKQLNGTGFEVEGALKPVEDEIFENGKKQFNDVAEKYREKAIHRCENTFEKAVVECDSLMQEKYDDCLKTIKIPLISHGLCAILKADFICNVVTWFNGVCNEAPRVKNTQKYDANMEKINENIEKLKKDKSTIKAEWQIPVSSKDFTITEAQKRISMTSSEIKHKLNFYQALIGFIITTFKRLNSLIIMFVMVESLIYQRNYIKQLDFDNNFITTSFAQIDDTRRSNNKKTVLPLDSELKKQYKNVSKNGNHFKLDQSVFTTKFFNWLFVCLLGALAFGVENIVRKTLLSIRVNTKDLGFESSTSQSLKVEVEGDGFAGEMVKKLLSGFEFDHRFTASGHMKDCLPKMHKMKDDVVLDLRKLENLNDLLKENTVLNKNGYLSDEKYQLKNHIDFINHYLNNSVTKFTLISLAILVVIFLESSVTSKLPRTVCSLFFPNRETSRIHFLYGKLLKRQNFRRRRVLISIRRLALAGELGEGNLVKKQGRQFFCFGKNSLKCILCAVKITDDVEQIKNGMSLAFSCPRCSFAWCSGCNFEFVKGEKEPCLICTEMVRSITK